MTGAWPRNSAECFEIARELQAARAVVAAAKDLWNPQPNGAIGFGPLADAIQAYDAARGEG